MPRSSASSRRLGRDGAGAPAGLVEGGRLAHEVGQLGGAAGQQHRDAAGVGGREVEGARRQVAVPEQGVAPAEVDEVAGPGGPRGGHPGDARVVVASPGGEAPGVPRGGVAGAGSALDGRRLVARRGRVSHLSRLTTRAVTAGQAPWWVGTRCATAAAEHPASAVVAFLRSQEHSAGSGPHRVLTRAKCS